MAEADRAVLTRWPDGTEVFAVPAPEADTLEALHDLIHHVVARALGLPRSPTLWRLAHGDDPALASDDLVAFEEAAVLALTAYARAAGIPTGDQP